MNGYYILGVAGDCVLGGNGTPTSREAGVRRHRQAGPWPRASHHQLRRLASPPFTSRALLAARGVCDCCGLVQFSSCACGGGCCRLGVLLLLPVVVKVTAVVLVVPRFWSLLLSNSNNGRIRRRNATLTTVRTVTEKKSDFPFVIKRFQFSVSCKHPLKSSQPLIRFCGL